MIKSLLVVFSLGTIGSPAIAYVSPPPPPPSIEIKRIDTPRVPPKHQILANFTPDIKGGPKRGTTGTGTR